MKKYVFVIMSLLLSSCATKIEGCLDTYEPVCAKKVVTCSQDRCTPLDTTYQNRCYAEKDEAMGIQNGPCTF